MYRGAWQDRQNSCIFYASERRKISWGISQFVAVKAVYVQKSMVLLCVLFTSDTIEIKNANAYRSLVRSKVAFELGIVNVFEQAF